MTILGLAALGFAFAGQALAADVGTQIMLQICCN